MHHRFSRNHQAPGRHRTLLAWLLVLLALPALVVRGPDPPDHPVDQGRPGARRDSRPRGLSESGERGIDEQSGLPGHRDGAIVVDPGSSVQTGEMVLRQIRKVTDKPLLAVDTPHVHGDHWLGNQAMVAAAPEVPIDCPPQDAGAGRPGRW